MEEEIYKIAKNLGLNKRDVDGMISHSYDSKIKNKSSPCSNDLYKAGTEYGTTSPKDVYKAGSAYGTTSPKDIYKAGTYYGTVSPKDVYKAGTAYGTVSIKDF